MTSLFLALIFAASVLFIQNFDNRKADSVEDLVNTVISVNGSSGVIVGLDDNLAYVLTSFHVVEEYYDYDEKLDKYEVNDVIPVAMFFVPEFLEDASVLIRVYLAEGLDVDPESDLALLKVYIEDDSLKYAKIAINDPSIGDEIYTVSNANATNYRSISKGMLSSKNKAVKDIGLSAILWQITGGSIIYGSSGGGVFDEDKNLISIIRSVDLYVPPGCAERAKKKKEDIKSCLIAIPDIAYVIPLYRIKNFLLNSSAKDKFEYLQ